MRSRGYANDAGGTPGEVRPRRTEGTTVRSSGPAEEHLGDPETRTALGGVKLLIAGYLAISVLTFVAIILLRGDASAVNDAVWVRGTIVVTSALLMSSFAVRAGRGSRAAYRRLRLTSAAGEAVEDLLEAGRGQRKRGDGQAAGVARLLELAERGAETRRGRLAHAISSLTGRARQG